MMHSPSSPSLSLKDRLLLVKGIGAKTAQELVSSPGRPEDVARILKARGSNHSARPQACDAACSLPLLHAAAL